MGRGVGRPSRMMYRPGSTRPDRRWWRSTTSLVETISVAVSSPDDLSSTVLRRCGCHRRGEEDELCRATDYTLLALPTSVCVIFVLNSCIFDKKNCSTIDHNSKFTIYFIFFNFFSLRSLTPIFSATLFSSGTERWVSERINSLIESSVEKLDFPIFSHSDFMTLKTYYILACAPTARSVLHGHVFSTLERFPLLFGHSSCRKERSEHEAAIGDGDY